MGSQSLHSVRVGVCCAARAGLRVASASRRVLAQSGLLRLKLLRRLADNPFVRRSAVILGLTLALSVATVAAIGEWNPEATHDSPGDAAAADSPLVASAEYAANHAIASPPPGEHWFGILVNFAPPSSPGYTIQRTVPEVRLQFTVADEQGRAIQDLAKADIRILDNQVPVERVDDFARDQDLPLRIGIVLDTSDSVKRVLAQEKASALTFLGRIMRPQSDRAFVMAFGADIRLWQASTENRVELMDAIDRLREPGWGTRLFDALYSACEQHRLRTDDPGLVHRALIVLSDGEDTDSFRELRDVVAIAQREEIQIYTLTLHGKKQLSRGDEILQRLAEQTGGQFFAARSSKELEEGFARIQQDLRTLYNVSFPPRKASPGFHTLRVEIRAPQKLHVHARQGYYAPAQ